MSGSFSSGKEPSSRSFKPSKKKASSSVSIVPISLSNHFANSLSEWMCLRYLGMRLLYLRKGVYARGRVAGCCVSSYIFQPRFSLPSLPPLDPLGERRNACFFRFAYPLLRNDFFHYEERMPGSSGRVTQVVRLQDRFPISRNGNFRSLNPCVKFPG